MSTKKQEIDLSKCKIGQRVRLRNGSLATLKQFNACSSIYPVVVENKKGQQTAHTKSGFYYYGYGPRTQFDIVTILPPAKAKKTKKAGEKQSAKEPMVDQSQEMIREAIKSAERTIFLLKPLLKP